MQLDEFRKLLSDKGPEFVRSQVESKIESLHHMQGENFEDNDVVARERRDKVKAAMVHAWSSYEKYAWGMDELLV